MGTETSVLEGIRLGAEMAGQDDIATGAHIASEVAWRVLNVPSAISDLVTDGLRELILPNDLKSGPLANDVALYHGGLHSPDIQFAGIGLSYEDIGAFAAERLLPASFLIGDARKVLDTRHVVSDHKDMISELAERNVPGFVHGYMRDYNGDINEFFAQVSLDGESVVTYVDDYDGPDPSNIRPNDMWLRDTIEGEARGQLTDWVSRTQQDALERLDADGIALSEGERAIVINTAVSTAYQQMKGTAIIDTLRERGIDLQVGTNDVAQAPSSNGTPENLLDQVNDDTDFQTAFRDLNSPAPSL